MRYLIALSTLLLSLSLQAAPTFPPLSGRVVDTAGILDQPTVTHLSERLAAHENATGNQVVIAIVKGLQGYEIRDYGYQLGRAWAVGQKDKNNGVVLLIAPKERKVAIEVGYGLEGQLTDAISHNIIQTQILPQFKQGDYPQGIALGTIAIIEALGGRYKMAQTTRANKSNNSQLLPLLFFFACVSAFRFINGGRRFGRRRGFRRGLLIGGLAGGGFSRGGRSGGGFSGGGGGSFGGGGASGGW